YQRPIAQLGIVAQLGMIVAQQFADPRARRGPDLWAERHEGVQRGSRKHRRFDNIDPAILCELPKIEHIIADRDADPRRKSVPGGEDAVGEILNRKIRYRIHRDKGLEPWVVGMEHCAELSVLAPPRREKARTLRPVRIEPLFQSFPAIGVVVL